MSYQPIFSPNQLSHDCHGVPAHPSVAEFPPHPHNQYYVPYGNKHPLAVSLNDAQQQLQLPAHPPNHIFQTFNNNYYDSKYNNNNNNNNINPYTDRYEYPDLIADKPAENK